MTSRVDPATGGYVIYHPTKRDAFEVVTDMNRPFQYGPGDLVPLDLLNVCPTCQVKHQHKTYHIMLNSEGRAVVSPGVYRGLHEANAFKTGGLAIESHTDTPPNQVLGTKNGMMGMVPSRRPPVTIYHSEQ